MKRVIAGLLGLVAIALAIFTVWAWAPDTDTAAMIAKYGGEEARWAEGPDGFRVHYRVSGPENGVPVVLIHGTAASLHTWEPLRARLEDRYRVVAYDQPGHGLTGPHPDRDYTYDGMADGLEAVLAAEGIERAVLIGNSMGGWVAWRHALARPDQVTALVLLDASGIPTEEASEGNLGFTLMRSGLGRAAMQRLTPRAAVEASLRQSVSNETVVTEAAVDRYWELLRYPGNRQAAGDQFTAPRIDASDRLSEVMAPTLILWGNEDQLVPVSSAQGFVDRMPNAAAFIYDGIGHLPMEETPDAVAADIRGFLSGVAAGEPCTFAFVRCAAAPCLCRLGSF